MSSSFSMKRGSLESLKDRVRCGLEAMVAPDAGHGRSIGSQVFGQGARAPVSRACGSLLERDANDLFNVGCLACRARAPRARGVLQQAFYARSKKARTPARCNAAIGVDFVGDVLVRHAVGGQQHDARAHLNARFDTLAIGKNPQTPIIIGTQLDWLGNSHGNDLHQSWRSGHYISFIIYGAIH